MATIVAARAASDFLSLTPLATYKLFRAVDAGLVVCFECDFARVGPSRCLLRDCSFLLVFLVLYDVMRFDLGLGDREHVLALLCLVWLTTFR